MNGRQLGDIAAKNDLERVALRFAAAMGADPKAMYDLLADDFVRLGEETLWQPLGKANYVAMSDNFLSAFTDVSWRVVEMLSDGNRVVLQIVETGTFSRPWVIGNVEVAPNDRPYSIRGAVFMTIADGQIHAYTYIHDASFTSTYADVLTDDFALAYYEFLIAPYAPLG
jgi:hypothetical protein